MHLSKCAEFSSVGPVEGKPSESPPHTLFLTSGIQGTVSEQMPLPRQAIVKVKIASRLMVHSSIGNNSGGHKRGLRANKPAITYQNPFFTNKIQNKF